MVKKAEEQSREAVEEERGFVDLFGGSSQSQMRGYSPPSPPPQRKKGGVPRIGDAPKRAGIGWTTTIAEGMMMMVAAIVARGKGKRRRRLFVVARKDKRGIRCIT